MECMVFDGAYEPASDTATAPGAGHSQLFHVQRAIELAHAREADKAALAGDRDDEVPSRPGGFELRQGRCGAVGDEIHPQFSEQGAGRDLYGRKIGEVVVENSLPDRHVGHGANIRFHQLEIR